MEEQKEQFEFTLEDILREFGSGTEPEPQDEVPVEPETPAPEAEPVEEETQDIPAEEPAREDDLDLSSDFWQSILHGEETAAAAPAVQPDADAPAVPHMERTQDLTADFWEASLRLKEDAPDAPAVQPEAAEEDVRIFTGKPEDYEKPEEPLTSTRAFRVTEEQPRSQVTGDTVRLDGGAVVQAAHAAQESLGDTAVFDPVTETETAQDQEPAEPFTQEWEPRYDEPMGEYVPPEPIVFRPRSRLGELKKKLVAGPERRYYALVEQGLGKLQISIFLSCLVVLLSVASVVMFEMHMVQENRMRLLVFGELFAMLLAAALGTERLLDGLTAIFRGKFTLETMLTVTFGVCIADCIFCLQEIRVPYCAAFCLEMTMAQWAAYERRNTEMGQMDTMRKATRLNRVVKAPDCYEGTPGFFVEDGEVEDFMEVYNQVPGPEKALNLYAFVAMLLSAGIGALAWMKAGTSVGVRMGAAALLAAMPATAFISMTRPMAVLERRMHKLGVVICGWSGAKACAGKAVVPLSDFDLFPGGSVKVNGVKFYSQRDPDDTVAYATALIERSGMGIASLFTQLLDSRYGRHYEPENFRLYENGGIGGDVCGESVLVGSLSFLQDMGVDMPEGARVNQAVYVAVDGELCGVFAMAYGKLKGVSAALGTLTGYRKLQPILTGSNFLLSESFIRTKFNANTRRMLFPDAKGREALAAWQPEPEQCQICALTTREELAGMAFAITGARALRGSMRFGAAMHMVFGLIGMGVVLVLSLIEGGWDLLTPANLLMVEMTWLVPGLLTTQWTRRL